MLDIISQRPFLLSFILAAFAIAAFWGWMQSGKRAALILASVFVLLIPVGVLVERIWVTDRERLVESIFDAAAALEANDFETVFKYIDPEAREALASAKAEVPQYEFHQVSVNQGSFRRIQFNYDLNPPEAIVDFNTKVVVSKRSSQISRVSVPRRLVLRFRKSGDIWRVVEYTHLPIIGEADGLSPRGGKLPTF